LGCKKLLGREAGGLFSPPKTPNSEQTEFAFSLKKGKWEQVLEFWK